MRTPPSPWWLLVVLLTACPAPAPEGPVDADQDGVTADKDCDDNDPAVNPNAKEVCDSVDNNCDEMVDEGVTFTYYADTDGDLFGDSNAELEACGPSAGLAENDLDCDDGDPDINPNGVEICNEQDDDCNEESDETFDKDGDGYTTCDDDDCDDSDPQVNPKAREVCDGKDNDCDGKKGSSSVDEDDDDKDGAPNCNDCMPNSPAVYPGAKEVCDGVDNNCNKQVDEGLGTAWCPDSDGDGHGSDSTEIVLCEGEPPAGYVTKCDDCNDLYASVNPDEDEICDGLDSNCDGALSKEDKQDSDGDGAPGCVDCDDKDDKVSPYASEVCGDGVDQDCSGADLSCREVDNDGDGFSEVQGDCDDTNPGLFPLPDVMDYCDDGIDNDCDGQSGEDDVTEYDLEPNDSMGLALELGTLDTTTTTCSMQQGKLTPGDEDFFQFLSVDQPVDNWLLSVTVTQPPGATYCAELLSDNPAWIPVHECGGAGEVFETRVDFVPYPASAKYWVRIYAEGAVSCAPYQANICAF